MENVHTNYDLDRELELELEKEFPNIDVIIFLIEEMKDAEEQYDGLIYVYTHGSIDILKLLDEKYKNPELSNSFSWDYPLTYSARNNDMAKTSYFIERGDSLDFEDTEGNTPLIEASKHGHIDIVKLLIANGANINIKASVSMTPLHYAADIGYMDIAEFLIKKGAVVDVED